MSEAFDIPADDASSDDTAIPLRSPHEPREPLAPVIADSVTLGRYADALAHASGPLALDAERASGYRYSQRAYLVQLRREGAGTALVDPTCVDSLDTVQQATTGVEWVLHAATQDLACLAEVGLRPHALFDTELAGRLLGRERVSLAALVASELGAHLEKGHGAADWSLRPLSAEQLRYAALDVELLIELRDTLDIALTETGKREIAQQEFDALLSFTPRERGEDAWRRTSGMHKVRGPRQLAIVRELWRTRDEVAQRLDIAPGRVLPDSAIVAAASAQPKSVDELITLPVFSGPRTRRRAKQWWQAIDHARGLPDDALPTRPSGPGGPPPPRAWADKSPDAAARLEAVRTGLAQVAERLHMPVENVLLPELSRRLAWEPPALDEASIADALRAGGAREWQVAETLPVLAAGLRAKASD